MKNSLFKRAIAVAAAAPLALTQCLTYANAVSNDAVQTEAIVQAESSSALTLGDLLYIPADQTVSGWNSTVSSKLSTLTKRSGDFDISKIAETAIKHAGQYKDVVEYAFNELIIPNGVKFNITGSNDIVITGKISEPDFNRNLSLTSGQALAAQADAYNAPALTKIDFSDINVGGDFTITIKASQLLRSTKVPVEIEYTTADGTKKYAGEIFDFALETIAKVKAKGDAAIEKEVPAQYADKAKADYAAKIKNITDKIEKAKKYFEKAMKAEKSAEYDNVSAAIADANAWLKKHNISKQIPATATDIASKEIVGEAYEQLINTIASSEEVNITPAEIGQFIDSIKEIKGSVANAVANGEGKFDDAEKAEVKAWVESQGYAFVDSYKKISATVDFSGVNTKNAGSVDIKIERVLVTDTTTTSVTTTSTDTTTTTTAESTTSSTSSSTTDVPTTSSTSSSTTSTTAESTTSSSTTSTTVESTTSSSTTSTTDVPTTSSTSSSTSTTSTSTTSTSTSQPADVTITTSIIKSYVTADTESAYYLSIEDEFDKNQITNIVRHNRYTEGYTVDGQTVITKEGETTEEIKDITFGTATPSNTYKANNANFMYEVPVYANGEVLKDIDGNDVTVTVYIALKGDANLDNLVDSNDASQVLAYYAKVSTNNTNVYDVNLSKSALATTPTSEYEEFAAFLADVHFGGEQAVERSAKKDKRLIDANDAAYILAYYARKSSADYASKTDKEIWDEVTKKTVIK